jgi:hypothetical protein
VEWIEKQFAAHSALFATRRFAVLMTASALIRVVAWTLLILGYVLRVGFVVRWFDSVAFVSVLSALALLLTDWAQASASAVGLSMVERAEMQRKDIAADIDQLLTMAEQEEAATGAREIAERLRSHVG